MAQGQLIAHAARGGCRRLPGFAVTDCAARRPMAPHGAKRLQALAGFRGDRLRGAARSGCGRSAVRRAGRGDSRGRFRRRKPLRRTRSFGTPAVLRILQWNRLLGHSCANFCLLDVRWGDFVHAVLAFLAEPAENLRQKRGEVLPVPSAHRSLPQSMPRCVPIVRPSSIQLHRACEQPPLPVRRFSQRSPPPSGERCLPAPPSVRTRRLRPRTALPLPDPPPSSADGSAASGSSFLPTLAASVRRTPLARSSSVRTCRLRPRTALPLPAFAAPAFRHKKTGPRRAPLGRPAGWTGRSSAPCAGNGDLRRLRRRAVHRTWQTYVSSRSCMPQNQRK